MCKKIALMSFKGGVGRTATVLNLGYALAEQGKKVLQIDMDPSRSLTYALGLEDETFGIAELLENTRNKVSLPAKPQYVKEVNGIDCIPCTSRLAVIAQAIVTVPKNETLFKRSIAGIASGYDYILVDCDSRPDLLSAMVIKAVDSVILPVTPDIPSLYSFEHFATFEKLRKQYNPDLEINGVLITMVDRTNLTKKVVKHIVMEIGKFLPVFKTCVPRSITVNKAMGEGQSVLQYQTQNPAAAAYRKLAEEILELDN